MQDILSTSPIMSSRLQTSSTPNTEDTKSVKLETDTRATFYNTHIDDSTPSLTTAMAFHYQHQNRNNSSNFSVSNLANLDTHQQRGWSYNSAKPFNSQAYSYSTQYQVYPDTTSNNFIYSQALPNAHIPLDNIYNNIDNTNRSPKNSPDNNALPTYQNYNPLSSSQISSSSFNTSQSSNKSNSPKLADFSNQCQSQQQQQQIQSQQHQAFQQAQVKLEQMQQNSNNVSSLSPLSSLVSSSSCNVSTTSSNFNIQNTNLTQIGGSVSGTTPGTESFEWMKPVKSQPNGRIFALGIFMI